MLKEGGGGYSPGGHVAAIMNDENPYAAKESVHWKSGHDENQEKIKRITKMSGPFMAH
jgi:hypothetical protein